MFSAPGRIVANLRQLTHLFQRQAVKSQVVSIWLRRYELLPLLDYSQPIHEEERLCGSFSRF